MHNPASNAVVNNLDELKTAADLIEVCSKTLLTRLLASGGSDCEPVFTIRTLITVEVELYNTKWYIRLKTLTFSLKTKLLMGG